MMHDPLEILGLAVNAGQREIKKRYRLLSKQFHPDLNQKDPEAEKRFREIQWAYETLSGRQTQKDDIGRMAARGEKQRSDPSDWSEEPFVGFFSAMKAYAKRSKSRSGEEDGSTTDGRSQNGEG
jgi:DnaJ-class molecular chaperone